MQEDDSINTLPLIDFHNEFKLPILYNEKCQKVSTNIMENLELKSTIDPSSNSIYSYIFNTTKENEFSSSLISQLAESYTTDIQFLKDNQTLLTTFIQEQRERKTKITIENYKEIISLWHEIKNDTEFKGKYYYLDWPRLEFMNKSQQYLQIMSMYNLLSPLISFIMPIIILIVPFFIIKMKGHEVTMAEYLEVLKVVIKNNAIGRLFTDFQEVELSQKIYLLVSACFYIFSIYQNVMVCIRFNNNMHKIHAYFAQLHSYLENTIESMQNYANISSSLKTHKPFNDDLNSKISTLIELRNKLGCIQSYTFSLKKLFEIGHILKYFYEFYCDPEYHEAMLYSFGFNGYLDCLDGLAQNIQERKVGFAKFHEERKKGKTHNEKEKKSKKQTNQFVNSYYAVLKDQNPVKNTIDLDKNIIITGPNASGKTTILKSTLINIILTQQFGCGFYESAKFTPYKHLHCYLNIPDTSGRDSLFQAEARRCKEIIDIIDQEVDLDENDNSTHFCAFDELFSGTNPEEAVSSATAFMKYVVNHNNVTCVLTTHFSKMCKKLQKNKRIRNCFMEVTSRENNLLHFRYLLKEGISTIKGGVTVLKEMNYPQAIIKDI